MSSQDFIKLGLQFALMLGFALFCGTLMPKIRQPAVLGETIDGIILGPTIFDLLFPYLSSWLFFSSPGVTVVHQASIKLGMLFFFFIADLEVSLSDLPLIRKKAAFIGLVGTLLPIGAGVGLVYLAPRSFWGPTVQTHFFSFALFVGMNLANSANPVIARILMDLGLLKGEIGSVIMTAAVFDDLVNWTLFTIILDEITPSGTAVEKSLAVTVMLVGLFFIGIFVIGRKLGPSALQWARKHVSWPSGFIALTSLLILIAGSISEGLGIHAFLGAFLVGAALGGNSEAKNEAHDVIGYFVLSFFAPIYFVSMGMMTDFLTNFDGTLVVLILVAACVAKIGSVLIGARLAGMPINRDSLAIGFGLNARGATGIILAGVGLTNSLIDERIFVAIVVMALTTSLIAGPAMNFLLRNHISYIENPQTKVLVE